MNVMIQYISELVWNTHKELLSLKHH